MDCVSLYMVFLCAKPAFRWLHLVQEIPRDKYTASPNLPWLDHLIRVGDEPETLHRISCSRQPLIRMGNCEQPRKAQ